MDETLALEALRQAGRKDFFFFAKEILGYPDLGELHKWFCGVLAESHKRLLILMPRGHLKSTIATIAYPLWLLVNNPNLRILIVNATLPNAKSFLREISAHMEQNARFREVYGDWVNKEDKWTETQLIIKPRTAVYKEPTLQAASVGANIVSQHFDIVILDDLVNRDNTNTMEQIEKVRKSYVDVLDILEPPKPNSPIGSVIVVGTRWHFADLYSTIMDKYTEYKIIERRALEGDDEDIVIFPEKFTKDHLLKLKTEKGASEFNAQYMNRIIDAETADFKESDVKNFFKDEDIKNKRLNKYQTIDIAIGEKKKNDYSVIMTVGVDEKNNWYVLEYFRDQVDPRKLINEIFRQADKHQPLRIGIEGISFQKALQFFIKEESQKRNRYLPIQEFKVDNRFSKEMRILALQPRFANRQIFIRPEMHELIFEFTAFKRCKTDDLADCMAYMLEIARKPQTDEHGHDEQPIYKPSNKYTGY